MFYLFKNSSLSQLSQLGWNTWLELNLYQVRLSWLCWQWKIGSNKAIDTVLAWYCWHCIYQGRARHWALQHRNTGGKLSSYGRTKTFFKKLPLKISCEGQELWLLTISIGVPPVRRQTRTEQKTSAPQYYLSIIRRGLFLPRLVSDLIERESGYFGQTRLHCPLPYRSNRLDEAHIRRGWSIGSLLRTGRGGGGVSAHILSDH